MLSAFFLSAIGAWGCYLWIQSVAPTSHAEWVQYLAQKDFSKYFNRAWMVAALIGALWMVGRYRLIGASFFERNVSWRAWGRFMRYFIYGSCLVGVIEGIELYQGYTVWALEESVGVWVGRFALSAFVVACIEEFVFRWVLLKVFCRSLRVFGGVFFLSLFFAYAHFKVPGGQFEPSQSISFVEALSAGWWQISGIVETFEPLKFLSLFFLSSGLCCIVLRTGTLLGATGLHAAIVWWVLSFKKATEWVGDEAVSYWLGGSDLVGGVLPCLVLFVFACLEAYRLVRKDRMYEKSA